MRRSIKRLGICGGLAAAFLACAFAGCAPGDHEPPAEGVERGGAPLLFTPLQPARAQPASPEIRRARAVAVNFAPAGFTGDFTALDANRGRLLELNLFEDRSVTAELSRVQVHSPQRLVWTGKLSGEEDSAVTMAIHGDVMTGTIRSGTEVYEIRYLGSGTHAVVQIDPNALPADDMGGVPAPKTQSGGAKGAPSAGATSGEKALADGMVIDVLVAYTAAAKSTAGGQNAIEGQIDVAIENANVAYKNSGLGLTLNLVHTVEVATTEGADILDRLQANGDGDMDEIHGLRDTYGADLVSLVIKSTSYCGLGYIMTESDGSDAPYGFSYVRAGSCLTSNLSFAHELGHNMGADHDHANAGSPTIYPYAYGYQVPAGKFYDIMAYACSGCKRAQYFANPDVSYKGFATGQEDYADVVRAFENTAPVVASYRDSAGTSNLPPVAAIAASPTSGTAPLSVELSGEGSTDADGSIVAYSWNFGDGSPKSGEAATAHTFTKPGKYTVTLTVTDDGGKTDTSTQEIKVSGASSSGSSSGGGPTCPGSYVLCDGKCVNLTWDSSNCGQCGNVCALGAHCSSGVCQCFGSSSLCGDQCVYLSHDEQNCGQCGNVCPAGTHCFAGGCK